MSRFCCSVLLLGLLATTGARAQGDTAVTVARGASLVQAGKYPEAIRLLTTLTEREPENGRAWHFLGQAHYFSRNYPVALAANLRAVFQLVLLSAVVDMDDVKE